MNEKDIITCTIEIERLIRNYYKQTVLPRRKGKKILRTMQLTKIESGGNRTTE